VSAKVSQPHGTCEAVSVSRWHFLQTGLFTYEFQQFRGFFSQDAHLKSPVLVFVLERTANAFGVS
jgi:hypothetical protein